MIVVQDIEAGTAEPETELSSSKVASNTNRTSRR